MAEVIIKVFVSCDRCGVDAAFTAESEIGARKMARIEGWQEIREGEFLYSLCPHCAAMFERFMGNKSTGNESSPHVDSVSVGICPRCEGSGTVVNYYTTDGGPSTCRDCNGSGTVPKYAPCPACHGEKVLDGVECSWCGGSGLKKGW